MLFEWLDVETLSRRPRFAEHDRETYDALLALCERLATDHFATHYRKSDTEEPVFDGEKVRLIPEIGAALDAFAKADLLTLTLDEELGGLQVPQVVASACMAWFTAANIGTAAYSFLTVANAKLLLAHGTPEQVERFVTPMLEGRFFGTMTLSEPHAGSSLGDVVALADGAVLPDEVLGDDEQRDASRPGRRVGQLGQDEVDDVVAHLVVATGDPHLAAEDPVGAVVGGDGPRDHVAEAGAGVRLGERHRPEEAPLEHRRHEALDLFGRAVGEQQPCVRDGEERVRRGADVGGGEPRHARRRHHVRDLLPADLLVERQREQVGLGEGFQRRGDLGDEPHLLTVEDRLLGVAAAVVRGEVLGGQLLAQRQQRVVRVAVVLGEPRPLGQPLHVEPLEEHELQVARGEDGRRRGGGGHAPTLPGRDRGSGAAVRTGRTPPPLGTEGAFETVVVRVDQRSITGRESPRPGGRSRSSRGCSTSRCTAGSA